MNSGAEAAGEGTLPVEGGNELRDAGCAGTCGLFAWTGSALMVAAWSFLRPAYVESAGGETLGWGLLASGAIVFLLDFVRSRLRLGYLLAGTTILVAGVADHFLCRVEATFQPEAPIFSWLGRLALLGAGDQVAVDGGRLLLQSSEGAFTFAPTWGSTAARPLIEFWLVGALVLRACGPGRRLAALSFQILSSLLFFALRYAACAGHYAGVDDVLAERSHLALSVFWSPWTILVTLLASGIAVGALRLPLARPCATAASPFFSPALLCVAGLSLGAAAAWSDPGTPKAGRVLIDDRLSGEWEPAGRLLDTERFGDFSAYSFAAMTEHLSRRFAVSVNGEKKYSPPYLDRFDVLVLKTPHRPLATEEIVAIQDWVERGGGLFAISDHTDLNGMSSHLNEIVDRFGIRFRFDSTSHAATADFDEWSAPAVAEHPVSAPLKPFGLMTGCSIEMSGAARPVLTLRRSASAAGDYAGRSHFGSRAPEPAHAHGLLAVAAAGPAGAGRILAFGDSTVLSSFAYYMDSHSEFVLRAVAWLNRKQSPATWLGGAWSLLGALALLLFLLRRPGVTETLAGAALLAASALGSAFLASEVAGRALIVPPDVLRAPAVGIVAEGGHAWLPPVLGSQPELPPHGNFMTFVQTPQRLGLETRVIPRDPALLATLRVLVLLNPDVEEDRPEAPDGWIPAVHDWVRSGGCLVLLSRRGHLGHDHDRSGRYVDGLEFEPQASPDPDIGLFSASRGDGRVIWVIGSEFLDTEALGHCMEHPGARERRRYEAAFDVFGTLSGIALPVRRTYLPD